MELTYLGKRIVPTMTPCGKEPPILFDCILRSTLALMYYHLDNPNSTLDDYQRKLASELVLAIETTLNNYGLNDGESPKSLKDDVLPSYLSQFNISPTGELITRKEDEALAKEATKEFLEGKTEKMDFVE